MFSHLNTIDLESLESKENSDTVPEVLNTTNRESERAVLSETTMETNNFPAPDESRFPLTSNEQIQETIKEAENKNTLRSTNTWMRVWYSRAKSRQINESIETMAPATLDGVLQKFYLEVRKQDGSEYEPDSLKVMQAALERYLSTQKYPYSLINSLEFSSSRAVLEAKAKQLRMQMKESRPAATAFFSRPFSNFFPSFSQFFSLCCYRTYWTQKKWLLFWPFITHMTAHFVRFVAFKNRLNVSKSFCQSVTV